MTSLFKPFRAAFAAGALLLAAPGWAQEDPLAGQATLERAALVRHVLERNPDVQAMALAVEGARQRVPQEGALMDPMLSVGVAPLSFLGAHHRNGVSVKLEQRLPFPGKRGLEADRARAEAEAVAQDVEQLRLQMALEASARFFDWYVVHRALEVNAHHVHLMEEIKRAAEVQYGVGMGSQQDPLQAEVELARMERERLMLEAQRQVLRARLNAMLRRAPDALLPPPATLDEPDGPAPDVAALREEALRLRPELKAVRARAGGSEAMANLARKSWLPDLGVMAEYSSMWDAPQHRVMAGVMLNLPVQAGMRRAMAAEARADVSRMRLEERARMDAIVADVDVALAMLAEARAALRLHRERLVPTARHQLAAARIAYESGRRELMTLVEAENNYRELQLQQHAAEADVHRRIAELDRAIGRQP